MSAECANTTTNGVTGAGRTDPPGDHPGSTATLPTARKTAEITKSPINGACVTVHESDKRTLRLSRKGTGAIRIITSAGAVVSFVIGCFSLPILPLAVVAFCISFVFVVLCAVLPGCLDVWGRTMYHRS